jgi:hypothetical protein
MRARWGYGAVRNRDHSEDRRREPAVGAPPVEGGDDG